MSYLIISDCFYPETKSISRHVYDLLANFEKKRIKTLFVFASEKNKNYFKKKFKFNSIDFIPINIGKIKKNNFFIRGIKEFVMPFKFFKTLNEFKNLNIKKTIIFSPSIFFSLIMKKIKKKYNCKIILIIRDIFPDWVIQKNRFYILNPFYIFAKIVSNMQFLNADIIACQEKHDKIHLQKKYPQRKIIIIYNWITKKKIIIKKIKNNIIRFVFLGTIGPAQDWSYIIRLIKDLNIKKYHFKFYFIGDGKYKKNLKKNLQKYKNVLFLKSLNEKKMLKKLVSMDVGVLPLDTKIKFNNIPGKFFSYMEANLPILCVAGINQEILKIVKNYKLGKIANNYNNLLINAEKFIKENINYLELNKSYNKCYGKKFSTKIAFKTLKNI
jgi:O26-antigen biosynthesis N-acetyl-L-fucosamine transferase